MNRRQFLFGIALAPFLIQHIGQSESEWQCSDCYETEDKHGNKLIIHCNMPKSWHKDSWQRIQHMCITEKHGVTGWTQTESGNKHVTFISGSTAFKMAFGSYA